MTDDDDLVHVLPLPAGVICSRCLHDDERTAGGLPGNRVVSWCVHTGYGGIHDPSTGRWTLIGPFRDFASWDAFLCAEIARLVGAGASGDGPIH